METESPIFPQGDASHWELLHLAGIAPLGVIDPEAGRRLNGHLRAGCNRCEGALERAWQDMDVLALTTPPVEPSPQARDRLLAAVGEIAQERSARADVERELIGDARSRE